MNAPYVELMNVQIFRVLHFFLGILRGTLQFLATALDIAAHALHGVATGEDAQHQQGQYCCGLFHVAAPLVITMGLRSVMQAPSPTLPQSYAAVIHVSGAKALRDSQTGCAGVAGDRVAC